MKNILTCKDKKRMVSDHNDTARVTDLCIQFPKA